KVISVIQANTSSTEVGSRFRKDACCVEGVQYKTRAPPIEVMLRVGYSPWWKKRCLSFIAAALALTLVAAPGHAMQQDDQASADSTGTQHTSAATQPRVRSLIPGEELTIQSNTIPLLQRGGKWGNPGNFIWMGSTGEPKSGTTWTETIITDLAVHLCGSSRNTWCQMGGLTERHGVPAPKYEWEMLY
ncbi:unnamed protein product, partial [Ascophyllum nodosum]